MRTKQVRPEPKEYEFELYISREKDYVKKKDYILFDFKTTKVFENFVYKINVDAEEDAENRKLEFNVEGLSAPVIALSGAGNAGYQYKLYDFVQSVYKIYLYKQRKNKNLFCIKILRNGIKITRRPSDRFINVYEQSYNTEES